MISIRTSLKGEEHAAEALRKSKAKFPGRQLVFISRNWGFTPFPKDMFQEGRVEEIEWRGATGTPQPISTAQPYPLTYLHPIKHCT